MVMIMVMVMRVFARGVNCRFHRIPPVLRVEPMFSVTGYCLSGMGRYYHGFCAFTIGFDTSSSFLRADRPNYAEKQELSASSKKR
jgi:hypothetical protein